MSNPTIANNTSPTPIRTVNVAEYGARPDVSDNTEPIRAALISAQSGAKPVVVRFAPGIYHCGSGPGKKPSRSTKPSFDIAGLDSVTIDGGGATIAGSDIAPLFRIRDSRNVSVRNLTIDWDPLPHMSGRVTRLLEPDHAFEMTPLVPARPISGRIVQGILGYNSQRHRLADNGWEVYQTQGERDANPTEILANGEVRVFVKREARLPAVGDDVVVRHQVYGCDAFVFANCQNVSVDDVTVLAAPGMAIIGWGCRDIAIRRVKVVPGESGWMSVTADAMHFNACRGSVTVEDCEFAGMGDDAINIHSMYGLITGIAGDRKFEVAAARLHPYYDKARSAWDAPAAGDTLEFGSGSEPLIAQGQVTVVTAQRDELARRVILTLSADDAHKVGPDTVLWNLSTAPSINIARCYVHGNRARGMLLQSRHVLVQNCVFEDISGGGIHICTDAADWWESLGSRDVTVRGCTFRRCNYGVARRVAAVDVFSDLAGGQQSAAGVHKGVNIIDNIFEGNTGAPIHLGSTDGAEIRGNRFDASKGPAIIVTNSRNVSITVDPASSVDIRGSSDTATIRVDHR
jgi:hypothetical protein